MFFIGHVGFIISDDSLNYRIMSDGAPLLLGCHAKVPAVMQTSAFKASETLPSPLLWFFGMRSAAVIITRTLFDSKLEVRFFHFAFTSTEITAPITLPAADIPPSEPGSACFYFFTSKRHNSFVSLCESTSTPGVRHFLPFIPPLPNPQSKSYELRK